MPRLFTYAHLIFSRRRVSLKILSYLCRTMSRKALDKELAQMDAAQMRQIILDAYDARRETKDYFEFFLNPDPQKLHDKSLAVAAKELGRNRWGSSKARVTVLKKIFNNFIGYNPGVEYVIRFAGDLLLAMADHERYLTVGSPFYRLTGYFINRIFEIADAALIADHAVDTVDRLMRDPALTRPMRRAIADAADQYRSSHIL